MGTTRDWLLFFHLATVVVAFAPTVAHALLLRHAANEGPNAVQRWSRLAVRYDQRIYGPALVLAGFFGIVLILSEDHWEFTQSWIVSAFVLWFGMNGALHGLIIPGERKVAAGDATAERKVKLGGALMTLLFVSMLHLMIFKPGWP